MCGSLGGINIADPLDLSHTAANKAAKSAEARATAAEQARQAGITKNVTDINSAFGGRQGQYDQLGAALRERYGGQLKLQQGEAARKLKFSLARGGLTGGSAQVDAGRTLSREATEGTLAAERAAQGGVAGLKSQDEASRLQLISLAQSGSDIGNAAAQTASALKANAEGAASAATPAALGDIFGSTAATYKAQQDAAARRKGLQDANAYANPFTRG